MEESDGGSDGDDSEDGYLEYDLDFNDFMNRGDLIGRLPKKCFREIFPTKK